MTSKLRCDAALSSPPRRINTGWPLLDWLWIIAIRLSQVRDRGEAMSIWTILFVILLIAWLGGFTVFHVAGGLIHLLLVFALISLVLHFVMGSRATG
jgi:uncharacterized protein DUF5670